MDLEVKVNLTKYMWWDGTCGGVVKDGQFLYLVTKPVLEFVGDYDEILCYPELPNNKAKNWQVLHGAQDELAIDEITFIEGLIDAAIPSPSGILSGIR